MVVLVIYDIEDDRLRDRVARACRDYGLQRIQFSAFVGDLNHNLRQELYQRLRRILARRPGNIQMWPICEKDIALRREIDAVSPDGSRYSDRYRRLGEACEL